MQGNFIQSVDLTKNQEDKNLGELYATPPNGKCPISVLPYCVARVKLVSMKSKQPVFFIKKVQRYSKYVVLTPINHALSYDFGSEDAILIASE